MRLLWAYILGLCMPVTLFGQMTDAELIDSLLKVNVQPVTVNAYSYLDGMDEFDTETLRFYGAGSAGNLVQDNSGIYLKSYGASGLSTLSIRGLSAEHAKVYWNGLELNSSMNGTIDLQTLPVFLLGNVGMAPGSGAMELGSGTFGGALVSYTQANYTTKFVSTLMTDGGSFGTVNAGLRLKGSGSGPRQKRWSQQGGVLYRRSSNNYSFENTSLATAPEQELPNASFTQYGGLYSLHSASGWSFHNLVTYTDRGIPPTMLNLSVREYQQDWLSLHSVGFNAKRFSAQAGYKYDYISYQQPLADINSPSHTHTAFAFVTYQNMWQFLSYGAQLNHRSQVAKNPSLDGSIYRPITGLYAYVELLSPKEWLPGIALRLRQEVVKDQFQPFQPSLTLKKKLFGRWSLTATLQRQYKYPTINERYWQPGGNEDLEAEYGLNTELISELLVHNRNGHRITWTATAYYMSINNWILWQPTGFGYWAPMNVKKVVSRGIDTKLEYVLDKYSWHLKLTGIYQFYKAINQETQNTTDAANGKLLIYSPQHVINGQVQVSYKGWYLLYRQNYTGLRYTTSDNQSELPAFTTGDVAMGKQMTLGKHQLELYFRVENLWDEAYQNIAWRPMPGRAFYGGLVYSFKK